MIYFSRQSYIEERPSIAKAFEELDRLKNDWTAAGAATL
jgi:hypothetical protein